MFLQHYYLVKFIYSAEKATKFCKIFTLILTGTTQDKSKVKISQNFVAFSEYMNFTLGKTSGRKHIIVSFHLLHCSRNWVMSVSYNLLPLVVSPLFQGPLQMFANTHKDLYLPTVLFIYCRTTFPTRIYLTRKCSLQYTTK